MCLGLGQRASRVDSYKVQKQDVAKLPTNVRTSADGRTLLAFAGSEGRSGFQTGTASQFGTERRGGHKPEGNEAIRMREKSGRLVFTATFERFQRQLNGISVYKGRLVSQRVHKLDSFNLQFALSCCGTTCVHTGLDDRATWPPLIRN